MKSRSKKSQKSNKRNQRRQVAAEHADVAKYAMLRSKCSVRIIRKYWLLRFKHCTATKLVQNFLVHGPTPERVSGMSFDDLTVFLRDRQTVDVTKQCLQRIHMLCSSLFPDKRDEDIPETINVRVFGAAFMIVYCSQNVFESIGSLEKNLIRSGTEMLNKFQLLYRSIEREGTIKSESESAKDFTACLYRYFRDFQTWKVPDELRLTKRIRHALIALCQAKNALPPSEPADSKLRVDFDTQITRLKNKTKQIAGEQKLKELEEELASLSPTSVQGEIDLRRTPVANSNGQGGGKISNEQLAHELLFNPLFQLDEKGSGEFLNPLFNKIRSSFQAAFWESLVDDLRLERVCYVRVLRVIEEIKAGLIDLADQAETVAINETIDVEFIRSQVDDGIFDWCGCKAFVGSVNNLMMRMQTAKRREESQVKCREISDKLEIIEAGEEPRMFCKALEFLLERVNVMRIDAANARLRSISPVIEIHGIEYEKGKFQDKLNNGTLSLAKTSSWLKKVVEEEMNTTERARIVQAIRSGVPSVFIHMHKKAMVSLIMGDSPVTAEQCPETLLFDVYRLFLLNLDFKYLVLASTVLVTIANSLPQTSGDFKVMDEVSTMMAGFDPTIDLELMLTDIWKSLEKSTLDARGRVVLKEVIQKNVCPDALVRKLMASRLQIAMIKGKLDDQLPKWMKDIRNLLPLVEKAALHMERISKINREVHGIHYNRIISEAAAAAASIEETSPMEMA